MLGRLWVRESAGAFIAISLLAVSALTLCPAVSRADLDNAASYALADSQQRLNQTRDIMFSLDNSYSPTGDFTAGDLVMMRRDYKVSVAAWEKAVAAYQRGDAVEGESLRNAAIKLSPPIDWNRRLQYRQRQYYLDLNDRWVLFTASWTGPQAMPALIAWVKAKKKCSAAWGRAAESMTADTDSTQPTPVAEIEAVEAARAADIEEEAAHWQYDFENTLQNNILRDKDISSPELTNTVKMLREIQRQRITLRLEDIDRQRRSRDLDRQLQQLQQDATKIFTAAQQARDEAATKAREQAAKNTH